MENMQRPHNRLMFTSRWGVGESIRHHQTLLVELSSVHSVKFRAGILLSFGCDALNGFSQLNNSPNKVFQLFKRYYYSEGFLCNKIRYMNE